MRAPLSTAFAIAVGIIVLLGYFITVPVIQDLRIILLGWAVSLAAIAALVGVVNLLLVHFRRLSAPQGKDYYSLFFIIAFIATLGIGLILGPADLGYQTAVNAIIIPIETSLMALLAVSLAYACLRLLQRRKGVMPIVFLVSTLVFLVLSGGFLAIGDQVPVFKEIQSIISWLPAAGARGILLGIALGSLTTGIRILMGADRPYSG